MEDFSDTIVRNKGLRIDESRPSKRSSEKLFLEESTLSMMEMETIYNSMIEGKLYLFGLAKLPIVEKILPAGTLLISDKNGDPTENKKEIKFSEIGKNIKKTGNKYFSMMDGFFVYENNSFQILPINKNAGLTVKMSKDAMTVTGDFYPPSDDGKNITLDDILTEFKKLNITAFPDIKIVDSIIKRLKHSSTPINDIILAEGAKPEPGKNGWVEYLVDTEKNTKPKITENGKVDFHNINAIHSVSENQKLAIVHPPVQGRAGMDVLGRVSPPKPLKEAVSPQGKNTYFSEKDPHLLLSQIDGYISKVNGKFIISEEYKVQGDVDFHTGNIVSTGAVHINGNVKSGFKLNLDKSIVINGFVNDAEISSNGKISITGGFGGSGKGKIFSNEDVSIRFVRCQTVQSNSDILVEKEAVDANLNAHGNILSPKGQLTIIGGTIVAGKDLEVKTLGNEYGVKTLVHVGVDFKLIKRKELLLSSIKEIKPKLSEREIRLRKYSGMKNLTKSGKMQLTEMISEYKDLKDSFEKFKNELNEIQNKLNAYSNSKVKVTEFAYPGVEIRIKNAVYIVKEKIRDKTFVLSEEEEDVIKVI